MNVQCATFSKSRNPRNIEKSFSDIFIRIRFPFESSFWISLWLQAHYPSGYQCRCQAKFLTSHHVRMHRVGFRIPNTLIELMIRA